MSGSRWKPLLHPVALLILVLTAILTLALQARAPWSGRAGWAIIWGVLAYSSTVLIAAIPRRTARPRAPADGVGIAGRPDSDASVQDLVPHIEEALRRLNDLAALSTCALLAHLPHTLSERHGDERVINTTPLDAARILRTVIVDGIEQLKPASGSEGPPGEVEVLRYAILHDEYVLGRPNHQIMARHSISESTFHRYRRVGTRALAAELARREHLLTQDPTRP